MQLSLRWSRPLTRGRFQRHTDMRTRVILMAAALISGLGAAHQHPCARSLGRSAQAFCGYFHELEREPLNPVERVVFSYVLANAKAHQQCQGGPAVRPS